MTYRIGWTITFEGAAFCESDLTLADTIRALEVAGGDWTGLHPLRGPHQFVGLLTAFLVACGENEEAALRRALAVRLVDALDMVTAGEAEVVAEERRPRREGGDPAGDRARPIVPEPSMSGGAARVV